MSKNAIPPVHEKILNAYRVFMGINGYQPSYAEVGNLLNITRSAVCQHIAKMERGGLVRRPHAGGGRSLTLLR